MEIKAIDHPEFLVDGKTPRIEVQGKNGNAIIYTDENDKDIINQVKTFLDTESAKGAHVRIMPDVHVGSGCVIGYTAHLTSRIIPYIIGVDIGCGVTAWKIETPKSFKSQDDMFSQLDKFIRDKVPSGMNWHTKPSLTQTQYEMIYKKMKDESYAPETFNDFLERTKKLQKKIEMEVSPLLSIGTLGGGNHFIEVDYDESSGNYWLVVHTGSRSLGKKTADFHQNVARQLQIEEIKNGTLLKRMLSLTDDSNEKDLEKKVANIEKKIDEISKEEACEYIIQKCKDDFKLMTQENFDDLTPTQAINSLNSIIDKVIPIFVTNDTISTISDYIITKYSVEGNKKMINSVKKLLFTFFSSSKTAAIKEITILSYCLRNNINLKNLQYDNKTTGLEELSGIQAEEYFEDMHIAQIFAKLNRRAIIFKIATEFFNVEQDNVPFIAESVCLKDDGTHNISVSDYGDFVESVHNYIDFDSKIIRKGAISAKKGEKVIIPMSMKHGIVLGIGKGNEEWNCSAPHGAGRRLSRSKARKLLSMDDFKNDMEGIWTSCVNINTIDEAPRTYKDADKITEFLKESVHVISRMFPVYNFKADEVVD